MINKIQSISYFFNPSIDFKSSDIDDLSRVSKFLEKNFTDYEIIIALDVANYKSYDFLVKKINTYPNIRLFSLESGINENLIYKLIFKCSVGDYLIIHDPQMKYLDKIKDLVIGLAKNNKQICIGVGTNLENSFVYNLFRGFLTNILKKLQYVLPSNSSQFRIFSRSLMNFFVLQNSSLSLNFLFLGNRRILMEVYKYELLNPRKYKRSFFKSINKFTKILDSNQSFLINLIFKLGIFGGASSLLLSSYTIASFIANDKIVEGWASLSLIISFLFLTLFVILFLISNFLSRLFLSNQSSYDHLIVDEVKSNFYDDSRLNIKHDD
jgi:hypothetical protein